MTSGDEINKIIFNEYEKLRIDIVFFCPFRDNIFLTINISFIKEVP